MNDSYIPKTLVDLAQIVAALGTWAAVITALVLARTHHNPDLLIELKIRRQDSLWKDPFAVHLVFTITNRSALPVTVNDVGWCRRRARWLPRRWKQQPIDLAVVQLPKQLAHGQSEEFVVRMDGSTGWLARYSSDPFFADYADAALLEILPAARTSLGTIAEGQACDELKNKLKEARRALAAQ